MEVIRPSEQKTIQAQDKANSNMIKGQRADLKVLRKVGQRPGRNWSEKEITEEQEAS